MDSTKHTSSTNHNNTTNRPTPTSTKKKNHSQLPPKPITGHKRTRDEVQPVNTTLTVASSSQTRRPRRSWSRRSVSWTPEEDARLIQLVQKESATPPSITASKTWSRVAAQLTNRTGKQCRERYLNQLKPGIRRDPWSEEEERILHEAHEKIGNKWVAIAAQLPGRTDNCVKNHWNSMLRKRQRREAARKAAEHQKNSSSIPVNQYTTHIRDTSIDAKSEADQSIHTGIATPSAASSVNDLPISSIPSPYTALSPLTPKRDVKLQISSLVATGTKEFAWTTPYYTRQAAHNTPSLQVPILVNPSQDVCLTPTTNTNNKPSGSTTYDPVSDSVQMADCIQRINHGGVQGTKLYVCNDASPMQCIASSSHVPGLLHDAKGKGKQTNHNQPLRRSSRLVGYTRNSNGVICTPKIVTQMNKGNESMGRHTNPSVGNTGNPLAALAAAASSVPHSPLTPESRFSTTSRSRSASPNRCDWDMNSNHMKRTMSANVDMMYSGDDCNSKDGTEATNEDIHSDKGTRKSNRINAIRKRPGKHGSTE